MFVETSSRRGEGAERGERGETIDMDERFIQTIIRDKTVRYTG